MGLCSEGTLLTLSLLPLSALSSVSPLASRHPVCHTLVPHDTAFVDVVDAGGSVDSRARRCPCWHLHARLALLALLALILNGMG